MLAVVESVLAMASITQLARSFSRFLVGSAMLFVLTGGLAVLLVKVVLILFSWIRWLMVLFTLVSLHVVLGSALDDFALGIVNGVGVGRV